MSQDDVVCRMILQFGIMERAASDMGMSITTFRYILSGKFLSVVIILFYKKKTLYYIMYRLRLCLEGIGLLAS